ncbi:CCA tRNA nucleotidyltransferase [Purpureocillium takamizusanense]|uniref:CCA tRNA nucleotidyltransferase n=1 Tax=Purpureocillium takamizusanense TaxID=2060973 RepID=A0A9Q8VD11_9HYPO|nr:CCA tRNA nucleotidyltransferase [Purpureocillium takamizusanense]UNI20372.1 CCA tRNA nucleotidyltransferase [Purpureocillium takamizusanense]
MLLRLNRHRMALKRKLDSFLRNVYSQSAPPPVAMAHTRTILLNAQEEQLRALLLDVCRSINAAGDVAQPVVLRWAGGWVRDKLLGIQSHDIDVAINAMTGVHFAQRMCDFCALPDVVTRHGIGPSDVGNLHNVARNPDKSKHLETAMVKILGLDLDFVNLRKETYADNSRNPAMEFGTAEEDALRRDATINALFFNLHTGCIEDFTGGLPDMAARVIRTPLDPQQTFTDDPLRVLRLIRFASRLQFDIDPATQRVMGRPAVLQALRVKISRERVGVELEKMLKGTQPRRALELLDELHLYHAIFTDPARESMERPDVSRWHVAYKCLGYLLENRSPGSIGALLAPSEEAVYVAWNLAAASPWMPVEEPPSVKKKANALPPVAAIAREGFRAPNKLTDVMAASHRHRKEILQLKEAVCHGESWVRHRDRCGMAIRRWDSQGGSWTLQVLSTLLVDAMEQLGSWQSAGDSSKPNEHNLDPFIAKRDEFISGWQQLLDHVVELNVYNAPSMKRLLDGHALAQALGAKPGKWTGKALDICMAWQLRNPDELDPSNAIEEVRKKRDELGIPLDSS